MIRLFLYIASMNREQELSVLFDVFSDKMYEEWDGHNLVWKHHPAISKEKFMELAKVYFSKERNG